MINSIQIKNYRGIKDMKIDNFKKYNVFTGDNGSCKTTILEALAISCTSVASLIKVARERDFKLTQNNISSFFYNTKISENINILINDRYETEINIKKNSENLFNEEYSNSEEKFLYEYIQKDNGEIVETTEVFIKDNGYSSRGNKYRDISQRKNTVFITPTKIVGMTLADSIKELIEKKRKNEILKLLNKFDSNIDDVISDGKEIKVSLKEAEEFMPLSSLGNGIIAILEIIINILDDFDKIYIDEIETGIHHLNYPKLCTILVEILYEKEVQLFITTHSKEFIEEFCYALREKDEELSLYRFEKIRGNQLKQKYYSREEVLETIHEGWDVR